MQAYQVFFRRHQPKTNFFDPPHGSDYGVKNIGFGVLLSILLYEKRVELHERFGMKGFLSPAVKVDI